MINLSERGHIVSWRCWVKGCNKTRKTRDAMEQHFFEAHRRTFLKRIPPAEKEQWYLPTLEEQQEEETLRKRGKVRRKGTRRRA